MRQYLDLVQHILDNGTRKENRTGVDTLSTFNYNYEIDLSEGFPLLTTKKVAWKNIVIELLWFLSGTNKAEFLKRHNCKFWDPWIQADGTVLSPYNAAWRRAEYPKRVVNPETGEVNYTVGYIDQVGWAIDRLKSKPMTRDLVISAWESHIVHNPPSATAYWAPCHTMWVMNVQNHDPLKHVVHYATNAGYTPACKAGMFDLYEGNKKDYRGEVGYPMATVLPEGSSWCPKCQSACGGRLPTPEPTDPKRLCLHLTQRSADSILGVPYNIACYALLTHLIGRFTGIKPGIFAHTLIDAHIYTSKPDGSMSDFDHIPGAKEQLLREPRPLPKLVISDKIQSLSDVEALLHPSVSTEDIMSLFVLEGYDPHPSIPFKVAP